MAYTRPSAWGILPVPLLSQRGNEAYPREQELHGGFNREALLVPDHLDAVAVQVNLILGEAMLIALLWWDIGFQIWMRLLAMKEAPTLPVIRMMAYVLYLLDFAYRVSCSYQPIGDWSGSGSGSGSGSSLCRKLRESLPRASNGYKCLRGVTTTILCSVLIYSVIEAQTLGNWKMGYFIGVGVEVHIHFPVVPTLVSLYFLTLNLLFSSKRFAEWIYRRQIGVDNVTFRFQLDRWRRWEQSSSLGLDLGIASNPLDEEGHRVPIYAPPQTILPGESLSMLLPAARQEAKRQMPLFVRCSCCVDDRSAINLAGVQPARATRSTHFWVKGKRREQQAYSDFLTQREMMLDALPPCLVDVSRMPTQSTHIKKQRLCASCTALAFRLQYDFNDSWFSSWVRAWTSARNFRLYQHLPNSIQLAASAETCHLCAIFWQELSKEQQRQLLQYEAVLESTVDLDLQSQASRRICIAFDKEFGHLVVHFGGLGRPRRWVFPARGHDSGLASKQLRGLEAMSPIAVSASNTGNIRVPEISDTGSGPSVKIIRRWLELSKAPINPDWVPSRLVDVSALSTSTICIKHRRDISPHDRRYIALSHCWGPADIRTYNKSTKETFESTLPLNVMAKTFKDLFWLADQLGIRYVWIDALCILQDDKDDWERESSTMFQMYLSATLTVAAAASWSSTEGLFRTAQSPRKSHCLLYGQSNKSKTGDGGTFAWSMRDSADATRPDNNIRWSRWGSRAWTLQEQALSSRTVYFTDTDVVFEEKDVLNGETSGLMMDTTENSVYLDRWMRSREDAEGHEDDSVASRKPIDLQTEFLPTWWAWVSTYTHRSLTNPNDRTVAILGLAQYLSRLSHDDSKPRYLAGLWEQDLVKSLLWYVRLGADTHPLVTRAPTWSWLSVQGGIINDSVVLNGTTTGVEIEHVEEFQPRRPSALEDNGIPYISPTLAKGSFIQLRGRVTPLIRLDQAEQPAYYYNSRADLCVRDYPELLSDAALGALAIASEQRIGPRCYPLRLAGSDTGPCVGWYIPDTTDDLALPETLHCLRFTVKPSTAKGKEDFTQPWANRGLALRLTSDQDRLETSDGTTPTYERIGYFEMEWRSTGAYLPFDGHHFKDLKYNPRRVDPDIDPHSVFKDCEPRTLRIY
jgi:hypothetical protein